MARQKWSWTPLQLRRAEHVNQVANELKKYWPLTLRQIYYQLVTKGIWQNNKSWYTTLSKLVKWMRIDEKMPWYTIEDNTQIITDKRSFDNIDHFLNQQVGNFLRGYTRCLIQNQGKHIEVWCEKAGLFHIFDNIVFPYCIRTVICRGYNSITFIADFYKRAEKAISLGKAPVILYFGDFDPSGVDMLDVPIKTLTDEMGIYGVEYKRIGLNPEHIEEYGLKPNPDAAKKSDGRYKKFVEKYGTDITVELDALHPSDLENMIRQAIENEIDMELFEGQREKENDDDSKLKEIQYEMYGAFSNILERFGIYLNIRLNINSLGCFASLKLGAATSAPYIPQ